MANLYFEQCIHNDKIPTKTLINLSQCQRAFNKTPTVEHAENYYTNLKKLSNTLRYRRIHIDQHPQFEYESFQSTNWNFEMIRVANMYKDMLIEKSEEVEDLKEKNKLLGKAMKFSNECSQMASSILFHKEQNRLFKYVNPQFHLAQTMQIAAKRFFNMYKYKTNYLAIKKAFQLQEISDLLWKEDEDNVAVITYKSKALLELANKLEDDECGQKVALLQKIVLKEGCQEEVK